MHEDYAILSDSNNRLGNLYFYMSNNKSNDGKNDCRNVSYKLFWGSDVWGDNDEVNWYAPNTNDKCYTIVAHEHLRDLSTKVFDKNEIISIKSDIRFGIFLNNNGIMYEHNATFGNIPKFGITCIKRIPFDNKTIIIKILICCKVIFCIDNMGYIYSWGKPDSNGLLLKREQEKTNRERKVRKVNVIFVY